MTNNLNTNGLDVTNGDVRTSVASLNHSRQVAVISAGDIVTIKISAMAAISARKICCLDDVLIKIFSAGYADVVVSISGSLGTDYKTGTVSLSSGGSAHTFLLKDISCSYDSTGPFVVVQFKTGYLGTIEYLPALTELTVTRT